MKKLNKLFIFSIISIIIINCNTNSPKYIGLTPEIKITSEVLEPSTDITVECSNVNMFDYPDKIPDDLITNFGHDGERDVEKLLRRYYNTLVHFCCNFYDEKEKKLYYNFGSSNNIPIFKEKLSGNKAVYTLKSNVVSTSEAKFFGHYGRHKQISLSIKYPEFLSMSKDRSKIKDEITITSTKPFFDETTFSIKKLTDLFKLNYYIVWISKSTEIKTDSTTTNWNFEKEPVPKEYYILDKITPYSITFEIPPFAKTGKVHIVNETGFEISGDKSKSLIVSKPNSYAYYSTKEELIILDESGDEIR